MKKSNLVLALVFVICVLSLSGCYFVADLFGSTGHECDFIEYDREESTCTDAGYVAYYCYYCGEELEEALPLSEHTPEKLPSRDATCELAGLTVGEKCKVCNTVIKEQTEIEKLPHTPMKLDAVAPDGATPGKTEGSCCSVCGCVIERQQLVFSGSFNTPENYDGSYGYDYLAALNKGSALTELYLRIDAEADYFHASGETVTDENFVFADIEYSDLGLDTDEAVAVWVAYRADRPLYYWISNSVRHTSTHLKLSASEEYADGEVRNQYNSEIYGVAERYITSAQASDPYSLSLAFHDAIIMNADYSYDESGAPSDTKWAHNIIGVLALGEGVCESYSKAFQLLLNFCGVENIYVKGDAGEPHAWNLVEIDDGEWYWFDLTWDDSPDFMWGTLYNYFCVTDSENVGWRDGPWTVPSSTFVSSHTPDAVCNTGIDFMYSLPTRSSEPYNGTLRDTFKVDGLTYAVAGSAAVQLVEIEKSGAVTVPETVSYMGVEYTVISVGLIAADGIFKDGSVADESTGVTSLTLPKTLKFTFGGALAIPTLREIVFLGDEYFCFENGVVYNADKSYVYAITDRSITSFHIGPAVKGFSATGTQFYNCLYLETFTVDESNPYFNEYCGVIYTEDMTELVLIPRAISGTLILSSSLKALDSDSADAQISYRYRLESVVIPSGLEEFTEAFVNCDALEAIYYCGTAQEWARLAGTEVEIPVYYYSETYSVGGWHYDTNTPKRW